MENDFINGLLRVAAFFTKQKILDRILFAEMSEVLAEVPLESVQRSLGGRGGRRGACVRRPLLLSVSLLQRGFSRSSFYVPLLN